jgi:hypothetical protein
MYIAGCYKSVLFLVNSQAIIPPALPSRYAVTAARRSPPCRYRGSRSGNRPAAYASRQRESRGRFVAPFRRDRARPDSGIRGTRQSRVALGEAVRLAQGEAPRKGGTTRSGGHGAAAAPPRVIGGPSSDFNCLTPRGKRVPAIYTTRSEPEG